MALPYLYDVHPSEPGLDLWHSGKLDAAPDRVSKKLAYRRISDAMPTGEHLIYDFLPYCDHCGAIFQLHTGGSRPGWGDSWLRIWARQNDALTSEAVALLPSFVAAIEAGKLKAWQRGRGKKRADQQGIEVTTWRPR